MEKTLKKILTYGTLLTGLAMIDCSPNPNNIYLVEGEVVGENYKAGFLNGFLGNYEEYTFLLKQKNKQQPVKYTIRGKISVDFDLEIDEGDSLRMKINEYERVGASTIYEVLEINRKPSNLIGCGRL